MIEVDVSKLKSKLAKLANLITELEEIKLNMFNELEDCYQNNWNDGHSLVFKDKVLLDSTEMNKVIITLKDRKKVFKFISSRYGEIGNKVKCNFDNEKNLIKNINSCINNCEFTKSILNSVSSDIGSVISEINMAQTKLETFKEKIKTIIQKIKEIENNISSKISDLDTIKINEFDFDVTTDINVNIGLLGSTSGSYAFDQYFLKEDLVTANIEKIDYYSDSENDNLNQECNSFEEGLQLYKSNKNSSKMEEKIEDIVNSVDQIYAKRKKYTQSLDIEIIRYDKLLNKMTNDATELGSKYSSN